MRIKETRIYQILVPVCDNDGKVFPMAHHWEWDSRVQEIAGGLTLMNSVRGRYLGGSVERMIPVNIAATYDEMQQVTAYTLDHYQQEAVLFWLVADKAMIATKTESAI